MQYILMGGNRSLKEVLKEALKLEAAKEVDGPPPRLREVMRDPTGTQPPPTERRRNGRPVCWQYGNAGHLNRDRRHRTDDEDDRESGNE
jgi:hypothetical protein